MLHRIMQICVLRLVTLYPPTWVPRSVRLGGQYGESEMQLQTVSRLGCSRLVKNSRYWGSNLQLKSISSIFSTKQHVTTSSTAPSREKGSFEKENIATVPNVLSLGRIVLSPVLGYLVVSNNFIAAFGLFAVTGLSDVADGYIARHYKGQSSMLGSVLDPLADKCLVSILCTTLAYVKLIPIPLAAVILGKDALLILASFYLRYITVPPPVTWSRYWNIQRSTVQVTPTVLGKLNTFFQLGLMALSLLAPVVGFVQHSLLQALWYVTGATTVGSGIHYLYQMKGFKVLAKKKPP